jgi:mannose-6-phosphate isomerase-like protein (cupin superfamily)
MKLRSIALRSLLIVAATVALDAGVAAQYFERSIASRFPLEWETDQFSVRRIAIAPRAQATAAEGTDNVLVFLSAGLDGRMPPAEAVWLPQGAQQLENLGNVRFEAIAIGLKDASRNGASGFLPEALPEYDEADVRILIDNPRVMVAKVRYRSNAYFTSLHFHSKDTVMVYLGGGYTQPVNGAWGAYRVARGDVDLVPANTLHAFGNGGFDPLEVLVIAPK